MTLAFLGLYPKHFNRNCTLTQNMKLKNPILQIGSFKNKKQDEKGDMLIALKGQLQVVAEQKWGDITWGLSC